MTQAVAQVPTYKFTVEIEGYVKIQRVEEKDALLSPKKFKGWLKYLTKQAVLQAGVTLPSGQVKGVIRYVDFLHQERDPSRFVRLAATPLAQLYGVPAKNLEWYQRQGVRVTPELAAALLSIAQPARIRVLTKEVPVEVIRYTQGVRDDIGATATENPHDVVLVKVLKPVEVTVTLQPTLFDTLPVPEWAEPPYPPAKTYIEAYEKLLDAAVELAKAGVASPFGGRDMHTVKVAVVKTVVERRLAPLPPAPELERVRKVWERLPQLIAPRR